MAANRTPYSGGIAKVLVVGNVATGKTSVIKRYVRNTFSGDYQTTIGVDFALKRVQTEGTDINVQLWDIAGQERFAGLSRIFYTHAVAAIVVFDLFDSKSFESAVNWKQDIDAKVFLPSGEPIPVLLLGNKADLISDENKPCVTDEQMEAFVQEHKFFKGFKCSAKTGDNIKKACKALVTQIVKNHQLERDRAEQREASEAQQHDEEAAQARGSNISLGSGGAQPKPKGGCCG
jgi:Ras-related protein Rab-32